MIDKYRVVLEAEDGDYVLTDTMTEAAARLWAEANEHKYGEGQCLYIRHCQ